MNNRSKYSRLIPETIVLVFTLVVSTACSSLPQSAQAENEAKPVSVAVHITNHGWHTGIIFPREKLVEKIPALTDRFPSGQYLEVGWGDLGFYQADEITVSLALKALLWPTDSVVHLVSVPESPYLSFPGSETRTLCLSEDALEDLGDFLFNSFQREASGAIIQDEPGIYGDSQFYRGAGNYSLFNTCNSWTARGLKSAGYEIVPAFKLTASSIMNYIDSLEGISSPNIKENWHSVSTLCE